MKSFDDKNKNEYSIGSSKECDIHINDPDMMEEKQGFIKYEKGKGWYIVRDSDSNFDELTTGIFITFKNWKEYQSNSDVPSKSHKLAKDMKIFFSYNVLKVNSV